MYTYICSTYIFSNFNCFLHYRTPHICATLQPRAEQHLFAYICGPLFFILFGFTYLTIWLKENEQFLEPIANLAQLLIDQMQMLTVFGVVYSEYVSMPRYTQLFFELYLN